MAGSEPDNDNLTAKQHKAIAALISEPTLAAAALKTGVGERTLYTWLSEPAFSDAYAAARRECVSNAIAQLQRSTSDAVKVLTSIMNDTEEKGATRLQAAKTILDSALSASTIADLIKRVEVIEAQHKEKP